MGFQSEQLNRAARIRKLSKTILESDLTNAVNGGAQSIDIGILPAGAWVLHRRIRLNAQFTGGGATAVGMTVGDASVAARYVASFDVRGGTAGVDAKGTNGAGPGGNSEFSPTVAQQTVQAIFTPDAGHNLAALTAGSVTVEILYASPLPGFQGADVG